MPELRFDASSVEPRKALDALPAGWYDCMIVQTEMKPTKSADGAYLELQLKVIAGEFANRVIYDRLNLQNANPVAVEVAYRTLSQICHSIGVIKMEHTNELHGKPLKVKLKVRAQDGYDTTNEVAGYDNINAVVKQPSVPGAMAHGFAASPSSGFTPPAASAPAPAAFGPPAATLAAPAAAPAPVAAPAPAAAAPMAAPAAPAGVPAWARPPGT